MGAFGAVPLDGWSAVAAVEQRVLSCEKFIEFGDSLVVAVFEVALEYDGELALEFFEVHEEFEEGGEDLVLAGFVEVGEQLVVGVCAFLDGLGKRFG